MDILLARLQTDQGREKSKRLYECRLGTSGMITPDLKRTDGYIGVVKSMGMKAEVVAMGGRFVEGAYLRSICSAWVVIVPIQEGFVWPSSQVLVPHAGHDQRVENEGDELFDEALRVQRMQIKDPERQQKDQGEESSEDARSHQRRVLRSGGRGGGRDHNGCES